MQYLANTIPLPLQAPTLDKTAAAALLSWFAALLLPLHSDTAQVQAQEIRTFSGHTGSVWSVAFSPDGTYALSGSGDNTMKLWEVDTGRQVRTFSGHRDAVVSVAFSPDGRYALAGIAAHSEDETMRLWEVATGKEIRTFSGDRWFNAMAISPDGRYIVYSHSYNLKKRDITSGKIIRTFDKAENNNNYTGISFSPDGQYLLTSTYDPIRGKYGQLKLWKVSTGEEIRTFPKPRQIDFSSSALSPDGKYALSSSWNAIRLWEVATGRKVRTFRGHSGDVYSVAFSPDGQYALSGGEDKRLKLWEIATGRAVRTFSGHSDRVSSVAFSPDGQYALSGSGDGTLKLWDISMKALVELTIKKRIENWQQKGKYESTADYRQRVTEEKRSALIQRYTAKVIDSLGRAQFDDQITATDYDADNQIFEVTFSDGSNIYVEVPVGEAPTFDQNLNRLRFSNTDFALTGDGNLVLRKADIYNPGNSKTYNYDSGREVAFNTAQMAANFDPIEVGVETDDADPNVRKGTKTIEVGKADVDVNIPETDMSNPDAIAVVIGNRRYQGDTPDVDFAVNDGRTVKEYLVKTLGFREGNIIYEENASKTRMEVLLGDDRNQGRLASYLKEGHSDVFFFYSGHGAPDPNTETGYLMPVDTDANALAITGYPLDVLYDNLGKLDARSVSVVIDACFSGATGGGDMLIQNASPIGIEVRNPAAQLENGFVVTASSGSQVSSWYPEKGHGLLTYFWLKGLQGAADFNEDNQVTTTELEQYLTDPIDGLPHFADKLHNRQQTPQVFGPQGQVIVEYE